MLWCIYALYARDRDGFQTVTAQELIPLLRYALIAGKAEMLYHKQVAERRITSGRELKGGEMLRLENVLLGLREGRRLDIVMVYIGGTLSVNRYKTNQGIVRREVRQWMGELAWVAKATASPLTPPIHIKIDGYFKDRRSTPDLANLHKVIGDALQAGLGINDKHFRFEDGDVVIGEGEPRLRITIRGT